MGAPRNLAGALLRAVLRLAPAGSRDWALAMLRELDFIGAGKHEGDFAPRGERLAKLVEG
jgi:hypothetical protein